jgi:hypothetical protein
MKAGRAIFERKKSRVYRSGRSREGSSLLLAELVHLLGLTMNTKAGLEKSSSG